MLSCSPKNRRLSSQSTARAQAARASAEEQCAQPVKKWRHIHKAGRSGERVIRCRTHDAGTAPLSLGRKTQSINQQAGATKPLWME